MELGIGTAPFGMRYGISNANGRMPAGEVSRILAIAGENKVRVIDTACGYGESEEMLGSGLPVNHCFDIVTKTPLFSARPISSAEAEFLEVLFHESLRKMKQKSVYGLLIHAADDLIDEGGEWLFKKITQLKQAGLVRKIGVSVYTAKQIDEILERYPIDLIQLPVSLLDQRLVLSGHLKKLKASGVEIHGRSIFLQGLIFMEPDRLPPFFNCARKSLEEFHSKMKRYALSPLEAALEFVSGIAELDVALCGMNTETQWRQILNTFPVKQTLPKVEFEKMAITDASILDPSKWRM